jgi:hypothetical protein
VYPRFISFVCGAFGNIVRNADCTASNGRKKGRGWKPSCLELRIDSYSYLKILRKTLQSCQNMSAGRDTRSGIPAYEI